jgi:hypothetical protein
MPSPVAMMTMVHKCSALAISTQAMGFAKRGRPERGGHIATGFVAAAPPLTNAGNGEQLSR